MFCHGAKGKKLPVIVSYHGGPSGSSSIRWAPLTRFFLGQGYAWVEPNVRGSTGFGRGYEAADNGQRRLDAFKDIETTGRWAASQPWADPDRVVVFGGSYGGYTVLVALTRQPDLWRAGIDLFGVANLKTFMATTSGVIHQIFLLEFGDPDKDAAFLDSISPVRDADKIVDPLFVYAGANDPRVPRAESDRVVKASKAAGTRIIARIDFQPDWARKDGVRNGPPDNYQDYADFIQAFSTRYRQNSPIGPVDAIEIWNEVNIDKEWGWRRSTSSGRLCDC